MKTDNKNTERLRAQLTVMSAVLQQLEVLSVGIGVEADVKLEAARQHTKISAKRQRLLALAGE